MPKTSRLWLLTAKPHVYCKQRLKNTKYSTLYWYIADRFDVTDGGMYDNQCFEG